METSFKVLICGGGVSGLSLTLILERLEIDYLVLEAYPEVTANVGAAVVLLPNRLRVLDQLGVYDSFKEQYDQGPVSDAKFFSPEGQVLGTVEMNDLLRCGDVLAGGDGIHSAVRKEMWRLGAELKSGYFPQDEWSSVPCFQAAIFGISTPPPNVKRLYWFLFLNLDEPAYGKDAPRFTKDDEARVVREHSDEPVMPDLKLGDLYSRSEVPVMTALQEHVFKKWHFQRVITFGDAAHKFNPETGQGANSAIETAASNANELSRLLKRTDSPSDDEISTAFSQVQEQRFDRVKTLVEKATAAGRADSFTTAMDEFSARRCQARKYPRPIPAETGPNGDGGDSSLAGHNGVTFDSSEGLGNLAPADGYYSVFLGCRGSGILFDNDINHVLVYGFIFFMWTLDGQRLGSVSSISRW
ncbi:FAD binding domain-containing protein [Diaporthe eres]|nr:FAD binding domain-containing protein [Diaporthe eres]